MKLIQCRYSSGQRVPLLVQTGDAAPLPILVPFIYVHNTAAAHLRAIQAFYTYAKSRELDINDVAWSSGTSIWRAFSPKWVSV